MSLRRCVFHDPHGPEARTVTEGAILRQMSDGERLKTKAKAARGAGAAASSQLLGLIAGGSPER